MEPSPVQIEYQYTEAEYLAANRLFLFHSPNVLVRLAVFCLFLIFAAVVISLVITDLFPVWACVAFVLLFEGALLYNILVRMPRTYFRGDAKFRDKYNITFSNEGIALKTSQIDSKLAWSLYTRVLENREMYLLIYGSEIRMMTAVPKRAFKSSNEEAQFRELISRHISDHSSRKQVQLQEKEYAPSSLTPPDWR